MLTERISICRLIAIISLVMGVTLSARAVDTDSSAAINQARASLITCYAGSEVYSLEGHTALRVVLPDGTDVVANYGLFDFDTPNFVYRFVSGLTDYRMGMTYTDHFLYQYYLEGRRVEEQTLNMTSQQVERLFMLLVENAKPQNATYRYNYVLDNCATRPVDMIEKAIGDTIRFSAPALDSMYAAPAHRWTFRDYMRHYHEGYPWYQFGIDLALGSGIDRPVTVRRKIFAPETLVEMMKTATVTDSTGRQIPVITDTHPIVDVPADHARLAPTSWFLSPLAVSLLVLTLTLSIAIRDIRRGKVTRWYQSLMFLIFGMGGCLIAFLIFISEHYATSPNWLLAWLHPLLLFPAIAVWLKKWKTALLWFHFVNFVVLFLLTVTWPWLGQSSNVAFWPLIAADAIMSACFILINRCATSNRIQSQA